MDEPKSFSVYLILAIIIAIIFFLNILLGIAYLLIPKDCIRCRTDQEPPRHYPQGYTPRGYNLRSIYVSGSHGQQVTIINGFVEVDDDFDAWAYWATDSEETLRGIPVHAQPQPQRQPQYGLRSDAGPVGAVAPGGEYGYQHHAERMELTTDGVVARVPGHRDAAGFGYAGSDFEPPMEFASERAVPRHPLARSTDIDYGLQPQSQSPAPTVRTWGRDSDATIRAVVESPRREAAGVRPKSYRAEGYSMNDPDREGY